MADLRFVSVPLMENRYKVNLSKENEKELLLLGQSKADALLFDELLLTKFKVKNGVELFEGYDGDLYTMKGSVTMPGCCVEVMEILKSDSSGSFRDCMENVFGSLFLDGVVLHHTAGGAFESMCIKWMSLQATNPMLPHRDYVFLQYADCYAKNTELDSFYKKDKSWIGAHVWESLELDGCQPLKDSNHVQRCNFRRCGFTVEEVGNGENVKVQFYLSEAVKSKVSVSNDTKSWMMKMIVRMGNVSSLIMNKRVASFKLVDKTMYDTNATHCTVCEKAFGVFKKRYNCMACGTSVCSKCSVVHDVQSKSIRACRPCGERPGDARKSQENYARSTSSIELDMQKDAMSTAVAQENVAMVFADKLLVKPNIIPINTSKVARQSVDPDVLRDRYHASAETEDHKQEISNASSKDMITLIPTQESPKMQTNKQNDIEKQDCVTQNTAFDYALKYSAKTPWPSAPTPENEAKRLSYVKKMFLNDVDGSIQALCDKGAELLDCEVGAVCILGDKTGYLMSARGLQEKEIPRAVLIESHVIMSTSPTIMLNANDEVRFVKNPLVSRPNGIKFYAGFPLVTSKGYVIGALSIADRKARSSILVQDIDKLQSMANDITQRIEQNTTQRRSEGQTSCQESSTGAKASSSAPTELSNPAQAMRELLKTAYSTQYEVQKQAIQFQNAE